MSGGYFDRSTYAMCEIADTIERDIARALQPKPDSTKNILTPRKPPGNRPGITW